MSRSLRFSANTVRTVGALLPPDVLAKVSAGEGLDGLGAEAYDLDADTRMRDVINDGWNEAKALWWRFQKELRSVPETDPATSLTRDKWTLPLFKVLGFDNIITNPASIDIAETSYPISHTYHHSPLHLMGARVELDGRAANIPGAARLSPHSLTQQFLNRSNDHLWGIVSNGRHLRLIRDSVSLTRQAYVEFDLEAMFNGEVFPDFNLLYRTLHATRFQGTRPEDCLLENWIAAARKNGIAARDQLRDGVENALTTLGTGFLTHPNNTALRNTISNGELTDKDLYRHLLRLVYRLLFLFVAEDRDLLHTPDTTPETRDLYTRYYSTQRLRNLAAQPTSTQHDDLWASLTALMSILGKDQGEPALGLPALGSFLWHPTAIAPLTTAHINNTQLLEALHQLSYLNDNDNLRRIDFAALGAEELGSIYESLLELQVAVDQSNWTFDLGLGETDDRKSTGSYYTPQDLVERVLDWTLDPAIESAAGSTNPEQAILSIKVLDPACGSGHFLIAAAHRLGRALANVRTDEIYPGVEDTEDAVRDVIAHCLYGVDINPLSVELCKIALWLDSLSRGMPLSFLDHHIREGNSLLGVTPLLLQRGIPNEAYKPQDDDDKAVARSWKTQNAKVRSGQSSMLFTEDTDRQGLGTLWDEVQRLPESTVSEVRAKAAAAELAEEAAARPRHQADSWCAAFLVTKTLDQAAIVGTPDGAPTLADAQTISSVRATHSPFHWQLEFPEVFQGPMETKSTGWRGGFDVVVGNPPFLNQLKLATAPSPKLATLFKARFPGIAKDYTDLATVFLELSGQLARPDGGRIGLVQTDSVLSAADAMPARQSVATCGGLEALWVAGVKLFDANVLVCVPVLVNGTPRPKVLRRYKGASFQELTPLPISPESIEHAETWAPLIAEGFGIPRVDLNEDQPLGKFLRATADFRDQYYRLVPFTLEAEGRIPDGRSRAALVTTGLIDPAALLWGERPAKFNKTNYDAPVVDLTRLRSESELGTWADRRLSPKLLLATQTRVLEVVVDPEGVLLPSVPVISIEVAGISLWHAAAALMSPPVTAWAAARYMGAALSIDALKLSASQVHSLPAPRASTAWDAAADAIKLAQGAHSARQWLDGLIEAGNLMVEAYGVSESEELMAWWTSRLPNWRKKEG